jgi:hypothetical protein
MHNITRFPFLFQSGRRKKSNQQKAPAGFGLRGRNFRWRKFHEIESRLIDLVRKLSESIICFSIYIVTKCVYRADVAVQHSTMQIDSSWKILTQFNSSFLIMCELRPSVVRPYDTKLPEKERLFIASSYGSNIKQQWRMIHVCFDSPEEMGKVSSIDLEMLIDGLRMCIILLKCIMLYVNCFRIK